MRSLGSEKRFQYQEIAAQFRFPQGITERDRTVRPMRATTPVELLCRIAGTKREAKMPRAQKASDDQPMGLITLKEEPVFRG